MENKHLPTDLKIMQLLPLHIKIEMTEHRIREWYENYGGDVYVSFSGGKDSTVLLDIARRLYPDIPAVFVDTGLEYPEVKTFVKSFPNVEILRPKMGFKEVLTKYGYPVIGKDVATYIEVARNNPSCKSAKKLEDAGRFGKIRYAYLLNAPFKISANCCHVMKKAPAKAYEKKTGRHPIIAILAEESLMRQTEWTKYGCNGFDMKRPRSAPMSFWTEQDVLTYIRDRNLPLLDLYGKIVQGKEGKLYTTGIQRTGCIFCMFGEHHEKFSKFERLKKTHPKLWKYCMKPMDEGGLGLKSVCEYCHIRTGYEIDPQTTVEDFLEET